TRDTGDTRCQRGHPGPGDPGTRGPGGSRDRPERRGPGTASPNGRQLPGRPHSKETHPCEGVPAGTGTESHRAGRGLPEPGPDPGAAGQQVTPGTPDTGSTALAGESRTLATSRRPRRPA